MSETVSSLVLIDDGRARRNTILLSAAHALYGMNAVLIIASGGLIGQMLAEDKGLATLPVSTFATGAAIVTVPAALYMRRVGRRLGFLTGAMFGLSGALIAMYAIYARDFWLFAFATFLTGGYQAFAQHYRFAAADVASESFKAKAIAWVLIGGLFAAVLGPMLIIWTKSVFDPVLFAGSYLTAAVLTVAAMAVLAFIDLPVPRATADRSDARPLLEILRQQKLVIAILCGMVTYGIMNLVMTASPLAMVGCGFSIDAATYVIQWHVLAMYVPSFFTGHLINRYGKERIIALGMALLAICAVSALSGLGIANFGFALVLLGLGWNFGFVGATALVTDCYRHSEKNKVQAFNDLCVFGTVACASFTSGKLLDTIGWDAIAWSVIPLTGVALVLLAWLMLSQRRMQTAT
jgi:predicted MFS family arabinose efflux permease